MFGAPRPVPLPRRPLDASCPVRRWYENELGWPTVPGDPLRLVVGVRYDVLDVPAEAGHAALRRLAPGSPVAVLGDRMRLLVAPGTAEELPGLLEWLEWGTLPLDLTAIGAGGAMEAPRPPGMGVPSARERGVLLGCEADGLLPRDAGGSVPRERGGQLPRETNPPLFRETDGLMPHERGAQLPRETNPPLFRETDGLMPRRWGGLLGCEADGLLPREVEGSVSREREVLLICGTGGLMPRETDRLLSGETGRSLPCEAGASFLREAEGSVSGESGGPLPCVGFAASAVEWGGLLPRQAVAQSVRETHGESAPAPGSSRGRPLPLVRFGSQGAAVWLRPPEPGCEVEASLPTLSALGGVGDAPDLVRLVNTVATQCHRLRLRRASAQPPALRAQGR